MQIGFAIVNSFDPQSEAQVSVVAQLYYILAVLFFFAVDGHHMLITALYRSGTALPLFTPLAPGPAGWLMVQEYGQIFTPACGWPPRWWSCCSWSAAPWASSSRRCRSSTCWWWDSR